MGEKPVGGTAYATEKPEQLDGQSLPAISPVSVSSRCLAGDFAAKGAAIGFWHWATVVLITLASSV